MCYSRDRLDAQAKNSHLVPGDGWKVIIRIARQNARHGPGPNTERLRIMIINREEYRDKVLGCWMGKNIGGTLGAPFEWRRQVNNVSFYTQKLGGEPMPNDDLDIQLIWLVALEERGIDLDAHVLSEYFQLYVTPHWSEYGTAKINMRDGLMPPLSGMVNNPYRHSCGAFIRSEIWACIAPGFPQAAARYAYEDAIIDHGAGEGMYAEVFCAVIESAAFVVKDIRQLINIALSYIPEICGVASAVRNVVASYAGGKSWQEARVALLANHRGSTNLGIPSYTSEADQKNGFHEGVLGYDAPSNIGIVIIGLLYGEQKFGDSICIAVNCGEDTDCTAATVGSIFGIIHGIRSIPNEWTAPIGRAIKTAFVNLGEMGYFGNQLPGTVDSLTDRCEKIAHQVALRHESETTLVRMFMEVPLVKIVAETPTNLADLSIDNLMAGPLREPLYYNLHGPVYRFDFFDVAVDYGEDVTVKNGTPKPIRLTITNNYKIPASLSIRWYVPEGWVVRPSNTGTVYVQHAVFHTRSVVEYTIEAESMAESIQRCVVEISMSGRHTTMLVPVLLVNGNLGI